MAAYYNDNDPFSAAWLATLIKEGLIPDGHIDDRSVRDVPASDLKGYDQVHLFAGIGGWPRAARLVSWPDTRPIWTGSCPCQPFSVAGHQKAETDDRHLWPAFCALITECRPAVVFGEQVASALGREWLAGVRADLETLAYVVGAADLCAASVGAPHMRQRLYWVADAESERRPHRLQQAGVETGPGWAGPGRGGATDRLGNALGARLEGHAGHGDDRHQPGRLEQDTARPAGPSGWPGDRRLDDADSSDRRQQGLVGGERLARPGETDFWSAYALAPCIDGKARRIEPGIQPLADGVPSRMGRLRAYGNAIVPQVAAEFISAWMEVSR